MARKTKKTKREPVAWATSWCGKADDEVTEYFKHQVCAVCGTPISVCGHHIIPRRRCVHRRHTFWNLLPLCPKHHRFSVEMAAHSESCLVVDRFNAWLKANHPIRWANSKRDEHIGVETEGKVNYKEAYEWWRDLNEEHAEYRYTCRRLGIHNQEKETDDGT